MPGTQNAHVQAQLDSARNYRKRILPIFLLRAESILRLLLAAYVVFRPYKIDYTPTPVLLF